MLKGKVQARFYVNFNEKCNKLQTERWKFDVNRTRTIKGIYEISKFRSFSRNLSRTIIEQIGKLMMM